MSFTGCLSPKFYININKLNTISNMKKKNRIVLVLSRFLCNLKKSHTIRFENCNIFQVDLKFEYSYIP